MRTMDEKSIRPFSAEEMETLSLFAERLNARRETGSTFCCSRAQDIRRDFEATAAHGFACWEGPVPLGLVSCFPDEEKHNADCTLLIAASETAYSAIAAPLLSAARATLPPKTACTFFFPTENADCRHFLEQAGAERQENEYILLLRRADWHEAPCPAVQPRPVRDEEQAAFAALHDALFPGVYASGADIWADRDQARRLYVIPDAAGIAAYGVLKTTGGEKATAEMLGVRPDMRWRGLGRAMLNHLARQAFSRFGAASLELVVDADNTGALRLYLNTGFQIQQENNCYILKQGKDCP